MTTLAVVIFALVYLGMALGRVPGLAIDRTGVALLGLIVLLATGDLTLKEVGHAIDVPTITLLFALMILSAQFESSGFYRWAADRITQAARNPRIVLASLIAVAGLLSALLTNDVVVFALTRSSQQDSSRRDSTRAPISSRLPPPPMLAPPPPSSAIRRTS
jgi:Na+/H+ antiporter NhaD/arsenite permease-like protein